MPAGTNTLEMSSGDLAGTPKKIMDKTFLLTLILFVFNSEMAFQKFSPSTQ